MKPGAGKNKGNNWERMFCKDLSSWWTEGKDKDVFWRTDASGGRKGISEEAGDVMSVKAIGQPFMDAVLIELKVTKERDMILDIIRGEKQSKIREWWYKLTMEAAIFSREPLLVVKLDRRGTFAFIRTGYYFSQLWTGLSERSCQTMQFWFRDGAHEHLTVVGWEDFKTHYKRIYGCSLSR